MIHNLSRDGFLISSTASNRSDNLFKKFTHLSQSRQSVQSIHHWVKYLLEVLTFPQTNYSSQWNKHSCYKIITVPTEPLKTNHNNWTTTTILKWVNKTKASWIVEPKGINWSSWRKRLAWSNVMATPQAWQYSWTSSPSSTTWLMAQLLMSDLKLSSPTMNVNVKKNHLMVWVVVDGNSFPKIDYLHCNSRSV